VKEQFELYKKVSNETVIYLFTTANIQLLWTLTHYSKIGNT